MPDPLLASIAAALASGATAAATEATRGLMSRLVALVRERLRQKSSDQDVLDEAIGNPDDAGAVDRLAALLGQRIREDPEFARRIGAIAAELAAAGGAVSNVVSGTVHGSVVQARDVQGGITLHGPGG